MSVDIALLPMDAKRCAILVIGELLAAARCLDHARGFEGVPPALEGELVRMREQIEQLRARVEGDLALMPMSTVQQ